MIYLDCHATTPVAPDVLAAMMPFFSDVYANTASKSHKPGLAAAAALEHSRETVLRLIGAAQNSRLVFTSGTTESNHLALYGLCLESPQDHHIVTQATEHPSVLEPLAYLRSRGAKVHTLGVDKSGLVSPEELQAYLKAHHDVSIVSFMLANHEIGTIQPVQHLAKITHEHSNALFFCDAAQAVGKIPVAMHDLDIDLMSFSAHKCYGPKGIGALVLGPRCARFALNAQMRGGGHENGMRSGTVNLPGVAGFAKALEIFCGTIDDTAARLTSLRDHMQKELLTLPHTILNGSTESRLPGNLNISFLGSDSALLLKELLPTLAVSAGSACASASMKASPVILALAQDHSRATSALRFGLGQFTTRAEIDQAIAIVKEVVTRVRTQSIEYHMMFEK